MRGQPEQTVSILVGCVTEWEQLSRCDEEASALSRRVAFISTHSQSATQDGCSHGSGEIGVHLVPQNEEAAEGFFREPAQGTLAAAGLRAY